MKRECLANTNMDEHLYASSIRPL